MGDIDDGVRFVIPGKAQPERKRQVSRGKWTRRVDTKPAAEFKAKCALFAARAMGGRAPFDEPLVGVITWRTRKPSGYRKHEYYPHKRPDLDNLCKSLMDGITGVVMTDDAKFVTLCLNKEFGDRDEVEVVVTLADPEYPYRRDDAANGTA